MEIENEELINRIDKMANDNLRAIFALPNGYDIYKKSVETELLLDLVLSLKLNTTLDYEKRKKLKEIKSILSKEVK